MKKKIIISLATLFILVITVIMILTHKNEKPFYLENNYYGTTNMTEIKVDELNKLIDNQESFAVFVFQPMCVTSSDFESVLSDFLEEEKISIYKIAFSAIKDTELGNSVRYYPSFLLYHEGKLVDFLEADQDEDIKYYQEKNHFSKWFYQYVLKKDIEKKEENQNKQNREEKNQEKEIVLEQVKREENKVNIYFFWGDGCPHCEAEQEMFESIEEQYGAYYNLYTFEVWHNKENADILNVFAKSMGDNVTGVPYTIIGGSSISGYTTKKKELFIETILREKEKKFDVYYDKILKK